jgi:hypothetical protein
LSSSWPVGLSNNHYDRPRLKTSNEGDSAFCVMRVGVKTQRKVEWKVKVLIKNLAIFFLFPSKQTEAVGNIMQYLNHEY